MLIALFADIHANRQAFSACLAQAREQGAERFVLLGDYVGYGADPEWTVTAVMDLVDKGAMAVLGNHDSAIGNPREQMNGEAQMAIEWTRGELGHSEREFLAGLPLTLEESDRLYVHSDASNPKNWIYVQSATEAARSLSATPAQITFCGHIHQPALYSMSATAKMTAFTPTTGFAIQLLPGKALARGSRLRRAAARRQPGRLLRHAGYREARAHLLPRALRRRAGRRPDPQERPADLAGRSAVCGALRNGQAVA